MFLECLSGIHVLCVGIVSVSCVRVVLDIRLLTGWIFPARLDTDVYFADILRPRLLLCFVPLRKRTCTEKWLCVHNARELNGLYGSVMNCRRSTTKCSIVLYTSKLLSAA